MRSVALVVLLLLSACAPFQARSPIGSRDEGHCEWVRARVADGSMPLELAWRWYEHCAPFPPVPGGSGE